VLLATAMLVGCQSWFQRHRAELRQQFDAGQYEAIAASLEDPETQERYGQRDRLLWLLDRGTVALALGDLDTAFESFNDAERLMSLRRRGSAADAIASLLINDTVTTYRGEAYEDLYVNVMKLLTHLEAGRLEGYATVEARRLATKVDLLRDEYLRLERRLQSGLPRSATLPPPEAFLARTEGGEFIESPLGTFLTAVTYMHTDDRPNQGVAARRLRQAIEAQGSLIGPVDPEPFATLDRLGPSEANVLIVALSGQGPEKIAQPIGPIYIARAPVYLELPIVVIPPTQVASARVLVDRPGPLTGPPQSSRLHLVEDLASVAAENHRRQLPLIYLRTLMRAAGKSIALSELNRAAGRDDNEVMEIAAALGGLFLLMQTERADLRSWALLPGQAHVGLLGLVPGSYRVTVEYLDAGGLVLHRTLPRSIRVDERRLATVVESYWR
jgi:hypothetical protein